MEPKRILVLIWHPLGNHILAGGFIRTKETLNRFSNSTELFVVEPSPTILAKRPNIHITPFDYPANFVWLDEHFHALERLGEVKLCLREFCRLGARLIREQKIEAIYVPSSELYWTVWAAHKLAKQFELPLILCNQNVYWNSRLTKPVHNRILAVHRQADLVITVSHYLESLLREEGVKSKVEVNENGLDTDLYHPDPKVKKKYDAIFVGRHVPEKGIYDLLTVWQTVAAKFPKTTLALAGSCDAPTKAELEKKIEAAGLGQNVYLLGPLSEADKIKFYQQGRFFLFPSLVEGWGLVPQEAMSSGIPVIAYDIPAYQENIVATEAAVLTPPSDTAKMAEAVLDWLKNPEEIERRGKLGRPFVERYSWPKIAAREEALIRSVLD